MEYLNNYEKYNLLKEDMDRRSFLKGFGALAASSAIACSIGGCSFLDSKVWRIRKQSKKCYYDGKKPIYTNESDSYNNYISLNDNILRIYMREHEMVKFKLEKISKNKFKILNGFYISNDGKSVVKGDLQEEEIRLGVSWKIKTEWIESIPNTYPDIEIKNLELEYDDNLFVEFNEDGSNLTLNVEKKTKEYEFDTRDIIKHVDDTKKSYKKEWPYQNEYKPYYKNIALWDYEDDIEKVFNKYWTKPITTIDSYNCDRSDKYTFNKIQEIYRKLDVEVF